MVVVQEPKVELTQSDAIISMKEEIFQLPFNNALFERVFPVSTMMEDKDLIVDMSDGTVFKIQVTKLK